jgi:hypothetical protein
VLEERQRPILELRHAGHPRQRPVRRGDERGVEDELDALVHGGEALHPRDDDGLFDGGLHALLDVHGGSGRGAF